MSLFHFEAEDFLEDEFPLVTTLEDSLWEDDDIPDEVGILTLKNTVLFPGVVIPITVGRDKSIQLVREAYHTHERLLGVVAQKNIDIEHPSIEDLYTTGTLARILKMIKMPDGSVTIVIQGRRKFRVSDFTATEPYFKAKVLPLRRKIP